MRERWQAIPEFSGYYEASDRGRVRRVKPYLGVRAGRILKHRPHQQGYRAASLWMRNKGYGRLVHRLVLAAFVGPPPDGMEVNHRNGDKTDNRLLNLEYVSRSENIRHSMRLGMHRLVGGDNPMAKIDAGTARAIYADHQAGLGYKRLAKKYGVTWGLARSVATGKTWRHVNVDA